MIARWRRHVVAVALSVAALPTLAAAELLPALNLGLTSFLDGGPPAGPGFYFQEYAQFWGAREFKDGNGDKVPILDNLAVFASVNQVLYQSDMPVLLGGKWGLDFILPLVYIDVDQGQIPILSTSHGVLGDILIGPYLQWDPIMPFGNPGPVMLNRIEIQNLIPTGTYDKDKILNPGSNFYSLNPYWAATVIPHPKWEVSWRWHYLWNAKNNDPNTLLTPNADDTQAGQATHINFASSYELVHQRFRVGVNGYYLKQFTNNEVDGDGIPNTREQVLGVGPGAIYMFSPNDVVFLNTYFETIAENRPEGTRLVARWTHHF